MGMAERIWDAFATVIKMNDKIERLVQQSVAMNAKVEDLTGRVIRLETALEIGMASRRRRLPAAAKRRGD
ncbi:MAG: hypothetical protein HYX46_08435 [Betaproteobacteria bacterium]|nr:hypothetical protein [Betaproteobacteria bacterium]